MNRSTYRNSVMKNSNARCICSIGTGKTATFSISILQQIDTSLKECQALILAPTRELAQQVCAG